MGSDNGRARRLRHSQRTGNRQRRQREMHGLFLREIRHAVFFTAGGFGVSAGHRRALQMPHVLRHDRIAAYRQPAIMGGESKLAADKQKAQRQQQPYQEQPERAQTLGSGKQRQHKFTL